MLTHQREAAIVERLEAVGSVTVDELSRLLGVSGTTIRRDLERLEQRAHLRRVHGGATIARTPESGQDGELDDDTREKEALARAVKGEPKASEVTAKKDAAHHPFAAG